MVIMQDESNEMTGGVDTHRDSHVAAVVDVVGRILGTASFPATLAGYRRLLQWMERFGRLSRVGVEGTGSYGAGLSRFLIAREVEVVEVGRPNRQWRRRHGKSDPADAEAAARAALNGDADGAPKSGQGPVEAIRVLRMVRRSALKSRTQAANQVGDLIITAPDQLRGRLQPLDTKAQIELCARFRPGAVSDPAEATKKALQILARRHQALTAEIDELDTTIATLCAQVNPALLAAKGVGPEVAATLLVAAGDNPQRMATEASFAALCDANPVEASSGTVVRHRLNRGGNRQANNALWRIVMVRLSCDQATRDYTAHRRAEGKTNREIIRCLKRYVAREIYQLLTNPPDMPNPAELPNTRAAARISLATVAKAINSWPTRISELERGLTHDAELTNRYHQWLTNQAA